MRLYILAITAQPEFEFDWHALFESVGLVAAIGWILFLILLAVLTILMPIMIFSIYRTQKMFRRFLLKHDESLVRLEADSHMMRGEAQKQSHLLASINRALDGAQVERT